MSRTQIPKKVLSVGLAAIFGLALCFPREALSNFASDDQRANNKTFVPFFIKRFHSWHSGEFLKQRAYARNEGQEFIAAFNKTATSFGEHTKRGFVRAYDYKIHFEKSKQVNGPYRFFDTENRPEVRKLAVATLKREAPRFDVSSLGDRKLGLGFSSGTGDIEVIVWEADLPNSKLIPSDSKISKALLSEVPEGKVILTLKDSKIVGVEVIQTGVDPGKVYCPPARVATQTDRILHSDGTISFAWHLNQYEELALDPVGRELGDKYRNALNLIPGTIEWRSYQSYAFSYP